MPACEALPRNAADWVQSHVDAVPFDTAIHPDGRREYPSGDYRAGLKFPSTAIFPARSSFGQGTSFGDGAVFGAGSRFGVDAVFGARAYFGPGARISGRAHFGEGVNFSKDARVGDGARFGEGASFDPGASFGERVSFGAGARFGREARFGPFCYWAADCTCISPCWDYMTEPPFNVKGPIVVTYAAMMHWVTRLAALDAGFRYNTAADDDARETLFIQAIRDIGPRLVSLVCGGYFCPGECAMLKSWGVPST